MRKMDNRQNKVAQLNFKGKKKSISKKIVKKGKRLSSDGR